MEIQFESFADLKVSQWLRSPLFNNAWCITIYPKGDKIAKVPWFEQGYVQLALDMVSTIKNVARINVFYNAVLLETNSHFSKLKAVYEASKQDCECHAAFTPNTLLKCSDLLKLRTITIKMEIYTFRPSQCDINEKYTEMLVTYWDKNCTITAVKETPPKLSDMNISYEWKICNARFKSFDNLLLAENGRKFMSNLFDLGYLKWSLICFPNGEILDEKGFVKLTICLVDTVPDNIFCIVIRYQFYCVEYSMFQSGLFTFRHTTFEQDKQVTVKWIDRVLSLDYVKKHNKQQITFGFDAEIVVVKNLQQQILYNRNYKFQLYTEFSLDIDL